MFISPSLSLSDLIIEVRSDSSGRIIALFIPAGSVDAISPAIFACPTDVGAPMTSISGVKFALKLSVMDDGYLS